jgi:chemotaxis protein methyltransferase CheR
MTDPELVAFLNQVAPRLGLRVAGYRRVGGTVRKRLSRRLVALGLELSAYARYLDEHPDEWQWLDRSCRITISRFGRDASVFDRLMTDVLPERAAAASAAGRSRLRIWSAGCASGEEAYTVAIGFRARVAPLCSGLDLEVVGTDLEPAVLARARRGGYPPGNLRELPEPLRAAAFEPRSGELFVRPEFRDGVTFALADLREAAPTGPFDVILCRNVAFTYFAGPLQEHVLGLLIGALRPAGVLVIGTGETLPPGRHAELSTSGPCFYTRRAPELAPPAP